MSTGEFWPEKGVIVNEWTLNRRDSAPAALSGNSIAVPLGEPYWTINVEVEVQGRQSHLASLWTAFFARRRGRAVTFTANRSFRSFPSRRDVEHDLGLVVHTARREDNFLDLRVVGGETARPTHGDMIGYFTANNGYYIGEIAERLNNGPNAAQMTMEPSPFPPHPTEANPRRIKAVGEFRLDGAPTPVERSNRSAWSFTATQVIRG